MMPWLWGTLITKGISLEGTSDFLNVIFKYMKMTKQVFREISEYFKNNTGYEKGGILGSNYGEIINCFFPDEQAFLTTANAYYPNVNSLNTQINKWARENIAFRGIIHCHLTDTPELSHADKCYIEKIMRVIPPGTKLYFPIILYEGARIQVVAHCVQYVGSKSKLMFCKEETDINNLF